MHNYKFLLVIFALAGILASSASADPTFTFVNQAPQFSANEASFSLYIGLWRGFDDAERRDISRGYDLMSQRSIQWEVRHCRDDHIENRDGETIWVWDELVLGADGLVEPIREAQRRGYRYFSLVNLNGIHLRGIGAFEKPRRESGESPDVYSVRVREAYDNWQTSASPKNSRGVVDIRLDLYFISNVSEQEKQDQFFEITDYDHLRTRPEFAAIFAKTAPQRWPISYDERAHKPHNFFLPPIWQQASNHPPETIRARMVWDWCDASLRAKILVPDGQVIEAGPNRSGRTDHGEVTIPVETAPAGTWDNIGF